jgi:hypothetical protein
MRRLTLTDIRRLRMRPGRTVALFLTDRCPVGCRHCSVDSRPDSPTVGDYRLLGEIVAGIGQSPAEVTAISGGEPFADRRALTFVVPRLRAAGIDLVLFTSGYWAGQRDCPHWIGEVLRRTGTVVLSTDAFHQGRVGRDQFRRAAEQVARADCRIVVQVLDEAEQVEFAHDVLDHLYGPPWPDRADVSRIRPVRHGRGSGVLPPGPLRRLDEFEGCGGAAVPTVRYDGVVTGCCNESVLFGAGPPELRRRIRNRRELVRALTDFAADPMLRAVRSLPMAQLARLPGLGALADSRYRTVCDACWRAHDLAAADPRARAALAVAGAP